MSKLIFLNKGLGIKLVFVKFWIIVKLGLVFGIFWKICFLFVLVNWICLVELLVNILLFVLINYLVYICWFIRFWGLINIVVLLGLYWLLSFFCGNSFNLDKFVMYGCKFVGIFLRVIFNGWEFEGMGVSIGGIILGGDDVGVDSVDVVEVGKGVGNIWGNGWVFVWGVGGKVEILVGLDLFSNLELGVGEFFRGKLVGSCIVFFVCWLFGLEFWINWLKGGLFFNWGFVVKICFNFLLVGLLV